MVKFLEGFCYGPSTNVLRNRGSNPQVLRSCSRVRDQLTHALTTDDSSLQDACAEGVSIAVVRPHAHADVSKKPRWCFKLNVYCAGKADAPDAPPPWDDGIAMPATASDAGGCAVGGNGSSSLVLVLGALGLVVARRHR